MPQQVNTTPALMSPGAKLKPSTVRPPRPGSLAGLQSIAEQGEPQPFEQPFEQAPFTLGNVMQEPPMEPIEELLNALAGKSSNRIPQPQGLAGIARKR